MDRDYWNKYYEKTVVGGEPSSFAQVCASKYLTTDSVILEPGCGNGRDSFYFASLGYTVYAFDQSSRIIARVTDQNTFDNLTFYTENVANIQNPQEDLTQLNYATSKINCIYTRFVLQALSHEEESALINWAYTALPFDGLFLIEARSIESSLYRQGKKVGKHTYFYNDHCRRFIDKEELSAVLLSRGFVLFDVMEGKDVAVQGEDNPVVIRVAAKKVGKPQ